jgi:hypothetical protein
MRISGAGSARLRLARELITRDADGPCESIHDAYLITARHAGCWSQAFPKGLAPTLLLPWPRCRFAAGDWRSLGRDAARVNKGHYKMNPNPRRRYGPPGPQPVRRPQNGAGNARQNYERYVARAREAKLAGDEVEMENCYQHAEHYLRIMRGTGDDQRY